MKVGEDAAVDELPLNDERVEVVSEKKHSRGVKFALGHLEKRRDVLVQKRDALNAEIAGVEAAIKALG